MPLALILAAILVAEPVALKAGDPAPFDGALVDLPYAAGLAQKRAICEEQNKQLREALAAKPAEATPAKVAVASLIAGGIALTAGILLGGWAVIQLKK